MSQSLTIGTDPPASQTIRGYALSHLVLIVFDISSMRNFYGEILGMRHIMTFQVSSTYEVTYMGYPVGDKGFQTGQDMYSQLRHRDGLLEFLHPTKDNQENNKSEGERVGRFSHIGIVVPNIKQAEKRLDAAGVQILKRLGFDFIEPGSLVAKWWGLDDAQATAASAGARELEWANVLFVADPEGNVIEMIERH